MTKKQFLSLAGVFILGCVLVLTSSLVKKHRAVIEWDGNPYNIENVNPLDAKLARPYNRFFDKMGDAGVALAGLALVLAVAVPFFKSKDKKKAFKVAFYDFVVFRWTFVGQVMIDCIFGRTDLNLNLNERSNHAGRNSLKCSGA